MYKMAREWRPDIIHVWGSMPAVYAVPIAKHFNVKLINTMIADAPETLCWRTKLRAILTFPFSDIIQANSRAGLNSYRVKKRGHVINNGYDMNRTLNLESKDAIRERYGIHTKCVVGMVACFRRHKDYETLVVAAKKNPWNKE